MDTRIKRLLSFAMAFFMVIGMMPVNVVRAEGTEGDGTEIVAETTAPETTPHVCDHVAVVTAPTCEAAGFTTYTCSCGDTYTADEVEATGHTYGEDDKCACGALNPAHEHSYTSVVTAPTCDAAGYTTNTCVCGDVTTTDEVEATGHTYGEDDKCACGALNPEHAHSYTSVVTAPTCDAAGYTTNTCACGDVTTTDEVEATGHTYGEDDKCACGALDPAHEHAYVEGKCVCGDERILMMSPPPTTEPTVKPCEEGCWMEEGHEGECEIVCTKDERCVLEDGHEGLCEAFGGMTLQEPQATVTRLDSIVLTAAEHNYMTWPSGDDTIDRPLQIVMNFKANDTLEEAQASVYGKYKCDFYLTVSGLTNGSLTADGCYLAGNYGTFGWIVIPADGLVLESGVSYPVVAAYDANLTYEDICGSVKDFTAAIFIAPTLLIENPNMQVKLELRMTNPTNEEDVLVIGEPAVYDVAALGAGMPDNSVAKIGKTGYETLEAAFAEASSGDTVKLLKDVTLAEALQTPAGITIDGNNKTIDGTIIAGGDLTFAGHTKVTSFSASYYDRTITIGAGASLEITGTGRVTLGYGNIFNITGSVDNAKTADKASIQPSLIIPRGISITGGNNAEFNVTNAYVKLGSTTTKNNGANGTFKLNFTNSIVEFTDQFTLSEPSSGMNPTVKVNMKNSVVTMGTKFISAVPQADVVIDNSIVQIKTYLRNSGTMTLKNGSSLTGSMIQFGESGGNNGVLTVDDSSLTIVNTSAGHATDGQGTGQLILRNNANVVFDFITKHSLFEMDGTSNLTVNEAITNLGKLVIDATDLNDGDVLNISGLPANFNSFEVKNKNMSAAIGGNGKVVMTALPVAMIGDSGYITLAEAIEKASAGATIKLVYNNAEEVSVKQPIVLDINGMTTGKFILDAKAAAVTAPKELNVVTSVESCAVVYEDGTYKVVEEVAFDIPDSDTAGLVVNNAGESITGTELQNILEQLESNTAVDADISGAEEVVSIEIEVQKVIISTDEDEVVPFRLSFDVTPRNEENKAVSDTSAPIKFKLPIPGTLPDHIKYAEVFHGTEKLVGDAPDGSGRFVVHGTGNGRYVEVTAKTFSPYDVELIDIDTANDKAVIGNKGYTTVQAAVDAVKDGETITLIKDCDENVSFTQTADKSFVLDGNDKTYTGSIHIIARADKDAPSTLVIKNFNFETTAKAHSFIKSVETNYYPNNVTVSNCTFTGSGADSDVVAVDVKSASDLVIENCRADNVHSLLQNAGGGWNYTVRKCKVTNAGRGLNLHSVQIARVEDVEIEASDVKYGIRVDGAHDTTLTIKNCKIAAFIPVCARKTSAKYNIVFEGTNTLTQKNTDGIKVAIGTSEYEANGSMPTAPTSRAVITVNDSGLLEKLTGEAYKAVFYGTIQNAGNQYFTKQTEASIGTTYYDKLSEAAAAGGNVVVLKDIVLDAPIEIGKNVTLTAEEPVTITATGDAFTVKENASLTIGKNITIDASMTASGENAVLSVTEGTVGSAKSVDGGKVNVTGGTVDKAIAGQDGIVTIGGDIEAVELLAGASVTSTITGGNIGTVTSADVEKFVSGGIFENEVAQKYLKDGMECVKSADKFIVKKKVVFAAAYTKEGYIYGEAEHIVAYDSFVVELYDADGNVIATSALVDKADGSSELLDGYVELITWNILLPGTTDSWWNTQWADTHPRADIQPAKVVLKADGVKVGEATVQMNVSDNLKPVKWPELDGVNTIIVTHTDNTQSAYTDLDIALNATVAGDKVHICTDAKVNNDVTASGVSITAEAGKSITIPIGKTLNLTDSTMKVDKVIVEYTKNVGSGTFNIAGETTLIIPELTGGGEISLLNETIIVDSTVGGDATLYGKVIFRGDNTFNMIYDYGDAYSETSAEWIVEAESSLTLNTKARYGLGYGDKGSVYGSLNNARTARGSLTDADISFFTHGLVAMSNWDVPNVFTVKDAYVVIGSNNSFGNSKSHTGSYEFLFENSVLDASRITFYEAASTTNFRFVDSDVKVGQFMTRDTDSIFTMVNTRFVSTATSNGTDEGNYHAGAMLLRNSSLSYSAPLVVENGTITMDAESMLTAPALNGTGKIVIDTSKMTRTEKVQVISGTTENTLTIEAGNAAIEITESGVWVYFDTFVDKNGNGTIDAGEGYGTLEAAVADAADGQTIYILHDTSLNEQIVVEKDITITAQASRKVSANITEAIVVASDATLTLGENVTFEAQVCANGGTVVVDGAVVTASIHAENGGTVSAKSGTANDVSVTGTNTALDVVGGTVTSASSANGAQINVSGGTVGSVSANENGTASISAGEITDVNASGTGAVITITGGRISGTVVAENGGKILIIGGWFKNDPSKDGAELAKGMIWDDKTGYIVHGTYVAFIDDNDNGIVDDGETGFRTMDEAAAAENKTVKLLNNLTDEITIVKSVTIDLNGYKTAAVTVKSGSAAIIDSSDNAGYGIEAEIKVEKGAGLELREVKVRAVNTSGKLTTGKDVEIDRIVANTGADVIITDGTINNGISVLGGLVTIKGGRINGKIAIEENADEDANIDVLGGIFGNPVPAEYCAAGYIPVDYEDGTYGVELSVVRYIDLGMAADGKIKAGDTVYLDGDAYPVGEDLTVEISNTMAKKDVMVLTTYTYQNVGQESAYPTAMYVWLVMGDKNVDGDDIYDTFKTERVSALDNFFKYEGTSIRVGDVKNGIRFFTSVHAGDADKLMQGNLITSGNLAGVKMVSAGTEFWKSADNKHRSEVYGGKVGSELRVFTSKGGRNWFTGVLTGLNTDTATIKQTINTRPYAQLKLTDGTVLTLYGGTLGRSILYVATQNKDTFGTGTAADGFVEGLIAKGNA